MNEGMNMVEMSFEGQLESLPSIIEVNIEKEFLNYNEDINLRNNEDVKARVERNDRLPLHYRL